MKKLVSTLLTSIALGGCALASKGAPLDVRYFDPGAAKATLTNATVRGASSRSGAHAIELGRVMSGQHLREKIAYRDSVYEIGFYDDRRWTERPEVYVRRELARTLFQEHGMRRALDGLAPVLDVEVLSFEEIRGASPQARVALRLILHDDHESMLERTIVVDRPVAKGAPEAGFVQAMAEALAGSAEQVAADAEAALGARAPSPSDR